MRVVYNCRWEAHVKHSAHYCKQFSREMHAIDHDNVGSDAVGDYPAIKYTLVAWESSVLPVGVPRVIFGFLYVMTNKYCFPFTVQTKSSKTLVAARSNELVLEKNCVFLSLAMCRFVRMCCSNENLCTCLFPCAVRTFLPHGVEQHGLDGLARRCKMV